MRFNIKTCFVLATIFAESSCECGTTAENGTFPWHVEINYVDPSNGVLHQTCGGSLISPNLVISAAHCVYDETEKFIKHPGNYVITGGNFHPSFHQRENYESKSGVKSIHVPNGYSGLTGNSAKDITLIRLETPFTVSASIRPVCIDWESRYVGEHLRVGRNGKVMGRGLTVEGRPGEKLEDITLPYIDYDYCRSIVPENFKDLITSDKICAGYLNGSNLCHSYSGGGLCFKSNGKWYLQGIASIGPLTSNGTCYNRHYTAFTIVGRYLDWIRDVYRDAGNTIPGGQNYSISHHSTGSCILPEQPEGGNFQLEFCRGSCNDIPGSRVPIGSVLIYQCREGYVLEGKNFSFCYNSVWSPPLACTRKNCPALRSTSVDISCKYEGEIVPCESEIIKPGTIASLECKNNYKLRLVDDTTYRKITCLEEGVWNHPLMQCVFDCGKIKEELHDTFPWHVGIYEQNLLGNFELNCGGTLIREDLVMSAAYCFYDEKLSQVTSFNNLSVIAGEYHGFYNTLQTSSVKKIHLPIDYFGKTGKYAKDIALIRLETPLTLNKFIRPICVDWDLQRIRPQSWEIGRVVEWNEDRYYQPLNDKLHEIELPYISNENCTPLISKNLRSYVSPDKFCVGYKNGAYQSRLKQIERRIESSPRIDEVGTGFCYEFDGIWYLIGVVSVTPEDDEMPYNLCTKTETFSEWIIGVEEGEEEDF